MQQCARPLITLSTSYRLWQPRQKYWANVAVYITYTVCYLYNKCRWPVGSIISWAPNRSPLQCDVKVSLTNSRHIIYIATHRGIGSTLQAGVEKCRCTDSSLKQHSTARGIVSGRLLHKSAHQALSNFQCEWKHVFTVVIKSASYPFLCRINKHWADLWSFSVVGSQYFVPVWQLAITWLTVPPVVEFSQKRNIRSSWQTRNMVLQVHWCYCQ